MENEKIIDMVEDGEIVETKFSKVKSYIKGNWKKIAVAVGAVAVGAIGYTFGKNSETIVYDLPPVDESDDVENASTPEE
ncbi:hypothetical protein [Blautia glucerasea]|uniref:hypothetical protein n=1 Tax=Blautia glucerasea TaxID=536633 RepID=UPI00157122BF|nr:hypothetical protein [Blautia glucerasea]NSJ25480.1 hypothetical protein [Blautia glucerasea]